MKPMTIIPLKDQLAQFFNADFLLKTAKLCGFIQRERSVQPQSLVLSLIAALSKGNCHSIADLHRQFNGMCLSEKENIAYKPFIISYVSWAALMKSFFRTAAIECHVTLSLTSLSPKAMTVTADTASERAYLLEVSHMSNKLLQADAGYVDFHYLSQLHVQGGSFIVRGGKSLNPTIVEAYNGKGRKLPNLAGKKLKDVNRRTNRSEVIDLDVWRDHYRFRVVHRWFTEESAFAYG